MVRLKLLLDECIPEEFRKEFPGYEAHSAKWAGYCGIVNGNLLAKAGQEYDVLITVDQNLRHQNKISKFNIGVILVITEYTGIKYLMPHLDAIKEALKRIKLGQVIIVGEMETGS